MYMQQILEQKIWDALLAATKCFYATPHAPLNIDALKELSDATVTGVLDIVHTQVGSKDVPAPPAGEEIAVVPELTELNSKKNKKEEEK